MGPAIVLQGEKVRKREDWSKWIPASAGNKSSSNEERSIKQSEKHNKSDSFKNDASGENIDKVCDDFASTFMFDEELELEHKDQSSSKTRYHMSHLSKFFFFFCYFV